MLTEDLHDAHADDSNMSHSVLDETKTAWGKQLARRVGGIQACDEVGHLGLMRGTNGEEGMTGGIMTSDRERKEKVLNILIKSNKFNLNSNLENSNLN